MEPSILKSIADNPQLLEAVKEVILKQFSLDKDFSLAQSNEQLGEDVRARLEGIKKVEQGFLEILTHKTEKEEPHEPMRAR